ncbi:MAG: hypothetical protein GF350_12000 [Chitinivibrionales bacterium]|nr:hypothetical protein [Chitinivibrionales bacterium]
MTSSAETPTNSLDIQSINTTAKTVTLTDNTVLTFQSFLDSYRLFWQARIAGETLVPSSIEHFMRRTSGKNLSALMKGKKMEGYMEGSMDKMLTRGQKVAIGTIVTLSFVGLIILIALKNQGMIPGM